MNTEAEDIALAAALLAVGRVERFLNEARNLYRLAEMAEEEAEQYLDLAREAGATEQDIEKMLAGIGR